jgi:hypothetical protein
MLMLAYCEEIVQENMKYLSRQISVLNFVMSLSRPRALQPDNDSDDAPTLQEEVPPLF